MPILRMLSTFKVMGMTFSSHSMVALGGTHFFFFSLCSSMFIILLLAWALRASTDLLIEFHVNIYIYIYMIPCFGMALLPFFCSFLSMGYMWYGRNQLQNYYRDDPLKTQCIIVNKKMFIGNLSGAILTHIPPNLDTYICKWLYARFSKLIIPVHYIGTYMYVGTVIHQIWKYFI